MKRYWRIRGYDSSTEIFDMTVAVGQMTDDQIKQMLKALAANAGLDYGEIVGAYAKRRTKIANDLLAVHPESESATFRCGNNPFFVAPIVDDDGKIIRHPILGERSKKP
jgi:hypothetical protein